MNEENIKLAQELLKSTASKGGGGGDKYITIAQHSSLQPYQKQVKQLLTQRKLPKTGWSEATIQLFLQELSLLDSNNFAGSKVSGVSIGIGEREGRVYSDIVQKRHFYLSHGIGRSGNLLSHQPKAAGSSLIQTLGNALILHALKVAGAKHTSRCVCVPMCTGMTICLVLLTLKNVNKKAKYVLWPRIDQLSGLKAIKTAGLEPVVIENKFTNEGEALTTDLEAIEAKLKELGPENVCCVLSTTSCFAPRLPDRIVEIGKLCHEYNVPHICNNAYGVQSASIMNQIDECNLSSMQTEQERMQEQRAPKINKTSKEAAQEESAASTTISSETAAPAEKEPKKKQKPERKKLRLDCYIQSTDKNFMVPVGGAVVASYSDQFIEAVASNYAGRASITPILDVFITLLGMGEDEWKRMLHDREKVMLPYFKEKIGALATKLGERLLKTDKNHISFAMTLSPPSSQKQGETTETKSTSFNPNEIGGRLFHRCVTGPRVVSKGTRKESAGIVFEGYGSHSNNYPHHYLTMACAIGISKQEIDQFCDILEDVMKQK